MSKNFYACSCISILYALNLLFLSGQGFCLPPPLTVMSVNNVFFWKAPLCEVPNLMSHYLIRYSSVFLVQVSIIQTILKYDFNSKSQLRCSKKSQLETFKLPEVLVFLFFCILRIYTLVLAILASFIISLKHGEKKTIDVFP